MDSCVTTLSDALAHLFAEGDRRMALVGQELDMIRIFEMGLWTHIAGYTTTLTFLTLAIYVWFKTRNRKGGIL